MHIHVSWTHSCHCSGVSVAVFCTKQSLKQALLKETAWLASRVQVQCTAGQSALTQQVKTMLLGMLQEKVMLVLMTSASPGALITLSRTPPDTHPPPHVSSSWALKHV